MRQALLDRLALWAIRAYQLHLSPRKGFSCAYRHQTGCRSCSVLGFRAIRRYGLFAGLPVLQQRLERCSVAYQRTVPVNFLRNKQAGFIDLSCDLPCSGNSGLNCAGSACDAISGCGGPCDCGSWGGSRRTSRQNKHVYIPPDSSKKNR